MEELFFYVTEDSVGVLISEFEEEEVLDIPLAANEKGMSRNDILNLDDILGISDNENDENNNPGFLSDSIYPELQRRPPGIL